MYHPVDTLQSSLTPKRYLLATQKVADSPHAIPSTHRFIRYSPVLYMPMFFTSNTSSMLHSTILHKRTAWNSDSTQNSESLSRVLMTLRKTMKPTSRQQAIHMSTDDAALPKHTSTSDHPLAHRPSPTGPSTFMATVNYWKPTDEANGALTIQ